MKKLTVWIATALLLLTFIPTHLNAGIETNSVIVPSTKIAEAVKVNGLLSRLDEIKAIDKSKLSRTEKKQLRNEVRTIEKALHEIGGGVYVSVGAILLIIILLIVLF